MSEGDAGKGPFVVVAAFYGEMKPEKGSYRVLIANGIRPKALPHKDGLSLMLALYGGEVRREYTVRVRFQGPTGETLPDIPLTFDFGTERAAQEVIVAKFVGIKAPLGLAGVYLADVLGPEPESRLLARVPLRVHEPRR